MHIDNLFSIPENSPETLQKISGLLYLPNYISEEDEAFYLQNILQSEWLGDLKRRVQHYGYKYDYKVRFVDYSMKIGELPEWVQSLALQLYQQNLMPALPDQLIINEYEVGQGITHHIDCQPCFGENVISISLGSDCVMEFVHALSGEKIPVLLQRRSLVLLTGEARHLWKHGIVGRKKDTFQGISFPRNTRTSLTFRTILPTH
ncbi:MAG: alpha-ketoglutarate-dependent dioxygenase AlkB [Bacteroidia bacterium]